MPRFEKYLLSINAIEKCCYNQLSAEMYYLQHSTVLDVCNEWKVKRNDVFSDIFCHLADDVSYFFRSSLSLSRSNIHTIINVINCARLAVSFLHMFQIKSVVFRKWLERREEKKNLPLALGFVNSLRTMLS